ncbi:MAG: type II restriction endonuclease subunit M, partial [Chloroflexota bacterium]
PGKTLEDWLRDDFFARHCRIFHNRPFLWHIWDGRKDGFSALVNYHKLDSAGLDKLIYTYLGDWIRFQRARRDHGEPGADGRLVAALELEKKLKLIKEGEPPYDIYVRWKPLNQQAIGWNPDLNDGVRLNIRPFVQAGVLRAKFTINWNKDRGKNPDGSDRENDLHLTIAEKRNAR